MYICGIGQGIRLLFSSHLKAWEVTPRVGRACTAVSLRAEAALAPARGRSLLLLDGLLVGDILARALALHLLCLRQRHLRLLQLVGQVCALLLELVQLGRVLRRRVLMRCRWVQKERGGSGRHVNCQYASTMTPSRLPMLCQCQHQSGGNWRTSPRPHLERLDLGGQLLVGVLEHGDLGLVPRVLHLEPRDAFVQYRNLVQLLLLVSAQRAGGRGRFECKSSSEFQVHRTEQLTRPVERVRVSGNLVLRGTSQNERTCETAGLAAQGFALAGAVL